ncbi:Glycosyltransferase involved in cell wall bisynthesis [Halogranum gelatinilyticum]|uniref:Glycosyltransferase involved in cell wall bisynthesis n=1 Tax=Halogranum gelatinilyticum TaxID=660521 RepID=A0A1G9X5C8_9EURY|nr:glycosyltransferase [Halogranum gelatinilyticum]SDM91892.1 Glycosyltransferase involved in cell wall bisynthesis [Halogranum gelatinilyticum]
MTETTDVAILLSGADEGSTPLEAASLIDNPSVSVDIFAWGNASEHTLGVEVESLEAKSKIDLRAYLKLFRILADRDYDVLHVHPIAIGSVATLLARKVDIPVVATQHNTHAEYSSIKNLVNGISNALSDTIVSNSYATKRSFKTWEQLLLLASGTEHQVIHYGADIRNIREQVSIRRSVDLPNGVVIGTGGRLVPQKNLKRLIRAVGSLSENYPELHLAITGDGPSRSTLEREVRERGLTDSVTFLGWLPERADVYAFYEAIDIFAFPSLYEGFGVANAEAMATGTPSIVSDIDVLREVSGDACIRVDPQSVDSIRKGIELLLDEDCRKEIGRSAQKRIECMYDMYASAQRYADLYREISR